MVVLTTQRRAPGLWRDARGDAVVEATILFPIIMMIFAGLVLLALYLPTRANLQRATQLAATVLATQRSDTWLTVDEEAMETVWITDKDELQNVYLALLSGVFQSGGRDEADQARVLTENLEGQGVLQLDGDLTVEYGVVNYVVYQEIVVTATRTIPVPVDLSFVGFPREIPVTVTSTAVVQNGDEFVRNIDLAADFIRYLDGKYNISEVFSGVSSFLDRFHDVLGI